MVIVPPPDKLTFQSPELWVYMLALTVLMGIALRRVLGAHNALTDDVYRRGVALEHVQDGVAWVRASSKTTATIGSINQALAKTLNAVPRELVGREWFDLFAPQDRPPLEAAFSQMLLSGKTSLDVHGRRMDGTYAALELLLVAVHDHKMRFMGHYCLLVDRTRERILEAQMARLAHSIDSQPSAAK